MIRIWKLWTISLALLSIAAAPAVTPVHISGSAITPSDWTVDQIQSKLASDIKPMQYTTKGAKHTFNCVPLLSLLKAAGAGTDFTMQPGADPKVKNPLLRFAVIVRGRDGYTVVFSLAELLPSVGNRPVWVALDQDGKPIPDSDGPVRLFVPDDQAPARSVHEVGSIEVVDIGTPTTQPTAP